MMLIWFMFFLVIFGISLIFLLLYDRTKNKIFKKLFIGYWLFFSLSYLTLFVVSFINSSTTVDKEDIYGKYEIDKDMFKGNDADWQFRHFSFEINKDEEFVFFEYYDNQKIKSKHKGGVEFVEGYASPHLKITHIEPEHQVVESEPLFVRTKWDFYYVFKSKKFGNVFFKKKKEEGIFSKF